MKKIVQLFCACFILTGTYAQTNNPAIAIIPEPVTLTKTNGVFTLPENIIIEAAPHPELKQPLAFLKERLSIATGSKVTVSNAPATATIQLQLNSTNKTLGKEGYQLSVTPEKIIIKANEPAGLFYGIQTLVQLFPKEIESAAAVKNIAWTAPCVEITDYPRFGWRGLMFDVSRHFFTKAEVKQFIDDMVRYKYNLLHFHLTDDEGWRIEIKSLPKLTEVGAWRVKKEGYFGTFSKPEPDEPRNYGGFYTHEDIRELVQYAKERFVNIMPEIDVPGHSLAAVASYPDLSCTEGEKFVVRSGEEIMDWSKGHPPIALIDNTLCPANEKVYTFLDKVMTEVAQLFPFEYIHVGGDEAPHNYWEKSTAVKALMAKEGLKTMEQVQSYFEKRLEKIVLSKGKRFMGWEEIMHGGGLSKSSAVMSWRQEKVGIEAAKLGHEVVMSPATFAYLDYMQADPVIEPRVYATLRLNKTYQFEPVPQGIDAKYIKGGQANLWTEQISNMRTVQYMLWPRGWAIAESVWSPKEKKNWDRFFGKVEQHFKRYDAAEKKYARGVYDPIFKVSKSEAKELKIEMSTEVEGLDIYYSFDNSFPDRFYPKYTTALTPPKDAVQLKVITYKGKEPVGRMLVMPVEELKKRADKGTNYQ